MKLSSIRPIALLLARELAITVLLILGVSFVVFIIIYFSPGDPFGTLLRGQTGSHGSANTLAGVSGAPPAWYVQYLSWLVNMLQGDFGTSTRTGLPVLNEVIRVGINTLYLTLGSMIVTLLIAVPIALFAARRGQAPINWLLTMLAYVLSALPVFWLGYIAIYISMHRFGLFPLAFASSAQKWNWFYFMLPVMVLGLSNGTTSEVVRYLREEMSRVFSEDYIRTARAKGASIWRHSFKEGFLIPITEIIASKIPFILGGAVVVEQVFNWPGMGRMAWQAAQDRDFPLIMGITLLAAVFVRMGTMLQRFVHILVNPRASKET
ncbi:MAG: ABC transporter permease [Desulfobacterales bacterium]|jgi:peptide/nickel transport system permease protein